MNLGVSIAFVKVPKRATRKISGNKWGTGGRMGEKSISLEFRL
jgi:hypothetical protein